MTQGQQRAERQGTAGRFTVLWMVVAVVMIAGLMAWLAMATRKPAVQAVEEGTEQDVGVAVAITLADLAADARRFEGQEVRLADVQVASPMGTQSFWVMLPSGSPYLVRVRPEVLAGGFAFARGDVVTVTGRIHAMSDSVLTAWQQEGAIAGEEQKAEAQYATTFLEASEAVPGRAGSE